MMSAYSKETEDKIDRLLDSIDKLIAGRIQQEVYQNVNWASLAFDTEIRCELRAAIRDIMQPLEFDAGRLM